MENKMPRTVLIATNSKPVEYWVRLIFARVERKEKLEVACFPEYVDVLDAVLVKLEALKVLIESSKHGSINGRAAMLFELKTNIDWSSPLDVDVPKLEN